MEPLPVSFAVAFGLTFALALLLAMAGTTLLPTGRALGDDDSPWGGLPKGYFIGVALFLALFRLGAALFGSARAGCAGALLAAAGLAILGSVRGAGLPRLVMRRVPGLLALYAAFAVLVGATWLTAPSNRPRPNDNGDPFGHFASEHTARYACIAAFAAESDRIPKIRQNYGQSLLALAEVLAGLDAPLISLGCWLYISGSMMALLLYETFRGAGLEASRAALGAAFVLSCNIMLSFTHVIVIDCGTPIIFNGYSDVYIGLGTWLVALDVWLDRRGQLDGRSAITLAAVGFAWSMCAPQNGPLALAVGGFLLAAWAPDRRRTALATAILLGAFAGGSLLGGMFLPKPLADRADIPGMMEVGGSGRLKLQPGLPLLTRMYGELRSYNAPGVGPQRLIYVKPEHPSFSDDVRNAVFEFERRLWEAPRVLFFPALGIAGLLWASRGGRSGRGRAWAVASGVALATAFVPAFLLSLGAMKFELTRFLLPGVLTGLMAFWLWACPAADRLPPRARLGVLGFIVACSAAPFLVELSARAAVTAVDPGRYPDDIRVRWRALPRHGADVLRECREYEARDRAQ